MLVHHRWFENDVKMYGTETDVRMEYVKMRLKMM